MCVGADKRAEDADKRGCREESRGEGRACREEKRGRAPPVGGGEAFPRHVERAVPVQRPRVAARFSQRAAFRRLGGVWSRSERSRKGSGTAVTGSDG